MPSLLSFLARLEPDLGKLETAYHKHNLKTDIAHTLFGLVFFNALSLFFIRSDYVFTEPGRWFNILLAGRLGFFAVSIWAFLRLSTITEPENYRRLTLILLMLGVIVVGLADYSRPSGYTGFVPVSIVTIMAVYLINPLPLVWRLGVAGLLTGIDFYSLSARTVSGPAWSAIIVSYFGANLMGAIISVWIHSHRSTAFLLLEQERKAKEKLARLSEMDPLTRAKNRRFFLSQGRREVERANRYDHPLALVVMDLDGLKRINDTHGHLAGDKALRAFVRLVRRRIRKNDIFARLGGDEFGLIMPETTRQNAVPLLERLIGEIHSTPLRLSPAQVRVSFSAGLAQKERHESLNDLFREADKKLYKAKRKGGNCLVS